MAEILEKIPSSLLIFWGSKNLFRGRGFGKNVFPGNLKGLLFHCCNASKTNGIDDGVTIRLASIHY
ncbi:MAG: hypothetical protein WCF90_06465 [Methanomicrobiales archaeon]